ncbi:F-box protein CPR30-like [Tripterygium wilfordii]|uniref:F-box protein CPR30-like n=1 Tax=Tripterygium wilfordii TaxID=458696 RepID=A0A7J7D0X1_TRIWF|nr:F-box protein CPR30-like [Tripterygium wilfordii]
MMEYGSVDSWSKQFQFALMDPFPGGIGFGELLGLRGNHESVWESKRGLLYSYHHEDRQVTKLGIRGLKYTFYLDTFVESLFLLDQENRDMMEEDIQSKRRKKEEAAYSVEGAEIEKGSKVEV